MVNVHHPKSPQRRSSRAKPAGDVAVYYGTAPVGARAVVRRTQDGLLHYTVTEIEGRNPRNGTVQIRNAGAFLILSGVSCHYPKAQVRLVVPTAEVVTWAADHPNGMPWLPRD